MNERESRDAALIDKEERFRRTFEHAPIGMAHVSPEGRYLQVNRKLCEILGYSREQLLSMTFAELTVPEDIAASREAVDQMLSGHQSLFSTEKRYRHKNGEVIWVNLVVTLEEDRAGRYFISVLEDITARKLAESRLHRLNRLHAVLSKCAEVIARKCDLRELYQSICRIVVEDGLIRMGVIVELNAERQAVVISSFGEGQEYLTNFSIPVDDGQLNKGTIGTAIRTGQCDFTNNFASDPRMEPWRDGALRHGFGSAASFPLTLGGETTGALVLFAAEQNYFQDDELRLMTTVAGDLSFAVGSLKQEADNKAMERSLRESEFRHRNLVEELQAERSRLVAAQAVAQVGSWDTDLATMNVTWSPETYRIFGKSPDDFRPTHESFLGLVHPDDRNDVAQAFADSINGDPLNRINHRVLSDDGAIRFAEERWQVIHDQNQTPVRVLGTTHDLTELRVAEDTLRQSELLLNIAGRLTRMGAWAVELPSFKLTWSEGVRAIHEAPSGFTPRVEEAIHYYAPEFRPLIQSAVEACVQQGTPFDLELQIITFLGKRIWVRSIGEAVRESSGAITRIQGAFQNISDRKDNEQQLARINRALQMLSNSNESLIRISEEPELLQEICRIAVDQGGYRMAWVGYALEDKEKTITPRAFYGAENGYLSEVGFSWSVDDTFGGGPAGRSIRDGAITVVEDVAKDRDFDPWRRAAQKRGYASAISIPLREKDRTFGILGLYSAEVLQVGAEELVLLHELADNLAFGIINLRSRLERQRIEAAVLKVAAGVSAASGSEFFEQLALSMAEAVGGHGAFVARLLPGEPRSARTIAAIVDGKRVENFDYLISETPSEEITEAGVFVLTSRTSERFPRSPSARFEAEGYAGQALINSVGEVVGLIGVIFRDPLQATEFVTSTIRIFAARAASELERQKSEALLREQASLLDKAQDAIFVRSLDGRITFWNKGAERIYGWTAAEAIGRTESQLLHSEEDALIVADQKLLEQGEWTAQIKHQARDGRQLIIEGRSTLVRAEGTDAPSVLAINTDITERKQLEEQFLRAQRMESIGTLAGGIAHDLNNVLQPILMFTEVLKRRDNDAKTLAALTTIQTSAKRGAEMVRRVLSFARGIEGQQINVDLHTVLDETIGVANETFPKNIQVTSDLLPGLWPISGDPTQLQQVLLNLCVNARDAMPRGGILTLSAENVVLDDHRTDLNMESRPGPYVMIEVGDNGVGIPPDVQSRIFDPFFTTKEVGTGTGLGLSTSLAIIKSHHGSIRVDSHPGKGSRFRIYLPARASSASDVEGLDDSAMILGHGELILVIDDEESVREATQHMLEAFGYRVAVACDGAEGIAVYSDQKKEIAVVLTDITMPVLDGLETIQVLLRFDPNLPIIAASGRDVSDKLDRMANLGIKHFLPKPYSASRLLAVLAQILKK